MGLRPTTRSKKQCSRFVRYLPFHMDDWLVEAEKSYLRRCVPHRPETRGREPQVS